MADGSVYWSIDEWLSAYALLVELGQTRLAVVVDDQYGLDHDDCCWIDGRSRKNLVRVVVRACRMIVST